MAFFVLFFSKLKFFFILRLEEILFGLFRKKWRVSLPFLTFIIVVQKRFQPLFFLMLSFDWFRRLGINISFRKVTKRHFFSFFFTPFFCYLRGVVENVIMGNLHMFTLDNANLSKCINFLSHFRKLLFYPWHLSKECF